MLGVTIFSTCIFPQTHQTTITGQVGSGDEPVPFAAVFVADSTVGTTTDLEVQLLTFNTSIVADDLKSGITMFGTYRNREAFDANDDGFTEIVELRNNTVGAKAFLQPTERSRISVNLNAICEYRQGGDRLDLAPQFTDITEELDHDTFIGGTDYEISSEDNTGKLQLYTSVSHTDRDSFYGGLGGGDTEQDSILANNAFGITKDLAWVNGVQYAKTFVNNDVLTVGTEFNHAHTTSRYL